MAHNPARYGPGGVQHRLLRIATVTCRIRSRALADPSNRRRVACQRLQHNGRSVALRLKPGSVSDDFLVQARESPFEVASTSHHCDQVVPGLDAMEVSAHPSPVPGVTPV